MGGYKELRSMCNVMEDGCGKFTMESVFSSEMNGEKYVTEVFRLKNKVDTEGKEETGKKEDQESKDGFNSTIGESALKGRTEKEESQAGTQKNEEQETISENLCGNEEGRKKVVGPISDEQLDLIFDKHFAYMFKDVIQRFGDAAMKVKCKKLKDLTNKDQRVAKDGLEDLVKEVKKNHGDQCDCEEYFKGLMGLYDSLSLFPLDFLEKVQVKIGKTEDCSYKKSATEEPLEEFKED